MKSLRALTLMTSMMRKKKVFVFSLLCNFFVSGGRQQHFVDLSWIHNCQKRIAQCRLSEWLSALYLLLSTTACISDMHKQISLCR